jgi:DNA-binding PadR family transcriptional regulator
MSPAVFAHGHLRLYLLSILADAPMHGYELIHALEERFGGTYTPSAGTIYPRLGKLKNEGLVSTTTEGRKTIYAITEAGRAELAGRESELDGIESDVTDSVRRLADEVRASVNAAMKSLRADLAAAAREARDESRLSGSSTKADFVSVRVESRSRLQDAEVVLSDFRHQIRSDLRSQMVNGDLGEESIVLLRSQLDGVRSSLRESFAKAARH